MRVFLSYISWMFSERFQSWETTWKTTCWGLCHSSDMKTITFWYFTLVHVHFSFSCNFHLSVFYFCPDTNGWEFLFSDIQAIMNKNVIWVWTFTVFSAASLLEKEESLVFLQVRVIGFVECFGWWCGDDVWVSDTWVCLHLFSVSLSLSHRKLVLSL